MSASSIQKSCETSVARSSSRRYSRHQLRIRGSYRATNSCQASWSRQSAVRLSSVGLVLVSSEFIVESSRIRVGRRSASRAMTEFWRKRVDGLRRTGRGKGKVQAPVGTNSFYPWRIRPHKGLALNRREDGDEGVDADGGLPAGGDLRVLGWRRGGPARQGQDGTGPSTGGRRRGPAWSRTQHSPRRRCSRNRKDRPRRGHRRNRRVRRGRRATRKRTSAQDGGGEKGRQGRRRP